MNGSSTTRLQRTEQDRPEDTRCPPREPLVRLVDGLEAVALRLRQAVDLDNREAHLDGTGFFSVFLG
jgi:hypothetical protein